MNNTRKEVVSPWAFILELQLLPYLVWSLSDLMGKIVSASLATVASQLALLSVLHYTVT